MNDFERDVKCFVGRAHCFPTYRLAICSPRPLLASNLACNAFSATSNRIWAVWWETRREGNLRQPTYSTEASVLICRHAVTTETESAVLLCLLMAQNKPRICNCTREYPRRAVIANGQKRKETVRKYSPANKPLVDPSFLSYNAM